MIKLRLKRLHFDISGEQETLDSRLLDCSQQRKKENRKTSEGIRITPEK